VALTRSQTITEAKLRAGRKTQDLALVNAYDAILKDITTRFPLINHQLSTGNTTIDQAYVTLPAGFRSREGMLVTTSKIPLDWA